MHLASPSTLPTHHFTKIKKNDDIYLTSTKSGLLVNVFAHDIRFKLYFLNNQVYAI